MSDVLEILKRGDSGLDALLRAVLLDSENKVPADRLRIVGALADGAIIEQGSNANGEYIRWADGTQVCVSVQVAFPTGGMSQDYMLYVTHPATFTSAWISVISTIGTNSSSLRAIGDFYENGPSMQLTNTQARVAIYSYKSSLADNVYFKLLTLGRWKA